MLADERHRRIVEIVDREGSARVRDLAKVLDVTEETIRRDLERLESDSLVLRRRGGAISIHEFSPQELPFAQREVIHQAEKEAIAAQAMNHIEPGDTIFLDASTTSLHIARMLPNEELVVLSYAFHVLLELMKKDKIRVVAIGGTLDRQSRSFVGPTAEKDLKCYHVNRAFYSCTAFHIEHGVTEANEFQSVLKKTMIRNARENFLLADSSKLGRTSLAFFAHLTDFSWIISDRSLDDESVDQIRSMGLNVELTA